MEKFKLEEIESLSRQIHEKGANPNRTINTDSISNLINERDRKMEELISIFAAEKACLTQLNRREGQILGGVLGQYAANVHEGEEHVL